MLGKQNVLFVCVVTLTIYLFLTALAQAGETCEASWYGPGLQGNDMANGETFDMNDPTVVAHKEHPFGTQLKVTNLQNGASIVVEVQDRGPFVPGRCIDLSKAGAKLLGYYCGPRCGTAIVRVTLYKPHPKEKKLVAKDAALRS